MPRASRGPGSTGRRCPCASRCSASTRSCWRRASPAACRRRDAGLAWRMSTSSARRASSAVEALKWATSAWLLSSRNAPSIGREICGQRRGKRTQCGLGVGQPGMQVVLRASLRSPARGDRRSKRHSTTRSRCLTSLETPAADDREGQRAGCVRDARGARAGPASTTRLRDHCRTRSECRRSRRAAPGAAGWRHGECARRPAARQPRTFDALSAIRPQTSAGPPAALRRGVMPAACNGSSR